MQTADYTRKADYLSYIKKFAPVTEKVVAKTILLLFLSSCLIMLFLPFAR